MRGLPEKLDALRVQIGQSLSKYHGFGRKHVYYKGISIFEHILTQDFFCIQYAPFKATSSLFNPYLTSFAIFHAFHDLFWAKMTLRLKSTANELWNGWKLAWYHNFTHIACAKKLRGLREKLDALRVQTGQSPSKYQGFGRKLIYYERNFISLTYFNSILFLHSICTIQIHIINLKPFSDFICYFSCVSWLILS